MKFRTITILTLASLAFLGAASLAFVVGTKARDTNRELGKLSGELDTAARREKIAKSIEALTRDTVEARLKLDAYFVGKDGIAAFLERLETVARERGLSAEITSVSIEKPSENQNDGIETLRVTVVTRGSFGNSFAFLTLLESLPYPLTVHQAALEIPTDKGETEGGWKQTVTLTVAKLR